MPRRSANADPADPAPALSRGIDLLDRLSRDGPQVLERLAETASLPKSSTLRLLAALERLGLVARDPATRRFHARAALVRGGSDAAEAARQRQVLAALARDSGQAAELWELRGNRLVMVDRADPEDASTAVRARIGYERDLSEADAVAVVAFAFLDAPLPARHTRSSDHRLAPASRASVQQAVRQCRREGRAADAGINSNGVRRFAAPLGRAVIALAQGGGVPPGRDDARLLALVGAVSG